MLDLGVDEVAEFGELHDVIEDRLHLGPRETEDRPVEVDVFSTGEIGVKPGPQLQQGRQAAPNPDDAFGRADGPGDALQQGALA